MLHSSISQTLLDREANFKKVYNTTYRRCRDIADRSYEQRNRHKLGQQLTVGQKVLKENHSLDLSKSQKLSQLRTGPYTVTKKITNTIYEIQPKS